MILKPAATYTVGDVAGYQADSLNKTLVMHRIVDTDGDRFTFKGDNNSWLDPDNPLRTNSSASSDPNPRRRHLAPTPHQPPIHRRTGLPDPAHRRRDRGVRWARTATGRRRVMAGSDPGPARSTTSWRSMPPKLQPFMTVAMVVAGLGILLGLFAWTRPTTASTTEDKETTQGRRLLLHRCRSPDRRLRGHRGQVAGPGVPQGREHRQRRRRLHGPTRHHGDRRQVVHLLRLALDPPLASPQPFDQKQYRANVNLNLNDIEKRALAGAEASGIPASDVTVTITPTITTADGDFRPELPMSLTPTEFSMTGDVDSLTVSEPTTSSVTTTSPNDLSFLGLWIPVSTARSYSLVLLALGIGGTIALAIMAAKGSQPTERELIKHRYKSLVAPVAQSRPRSER